MVLTLTLATCLLCLSTSALAGTVVLQPISSSTCVPNSTQVFVTVQLTDVQKLIKNLGLSIRYDRAVLTFQGFDWSLAPTTWSLSANDTLQGLNLWAFGQNFQAPKSLGYVRFRVRTCPAVSNIVIPWLAYDIATYNVRHTTLRVPR